MGYGTTLTPILLLIGYEPAQIVPSVLLSEFFTGVLAGVLHHEFGNANLKAGSRSFKIAMVLTGCSIAGTLIAVLVAVSISAVALKAYISLLVLAVGLTILFTVGKQFEFSWKKLVGLGVLAALNKGLSGGGYGPLVCGGQVLSGVRPKEAIGITSLAEGLTCIVGVIAYVVAGGGAVEWTLAPSLILGATISVPFAALTVKKAPMEKMRWAIGSVVTGLGLYTLVKIVL
jgi:uncharacterized membrane protein YfcA